MKKMNLINKQYNRLLVIGYEYTKKYAPYYRCLCNPEFGGCGNEVIVRGYCLINGNTKSCGCLVRDNIIKLNKTRIWTVESRTKSSMSHLNQTRSEWTGFTSDLSEQIYKWLNRINWYNNIKIKDNYTCQICGDNKGGNLVAHHLEGLSFIIKQYNIKSLNDAKHCDLFYNLDNGITLCKNCHKEFHHQYGYGNNTKRQFEEFINNG